MNEIEDKWALEIGKVFLAFGQIEHVSLTCLRLLPNDNIFNASSKLQLAQRIDLILEILDARPGETFSRLKALFVRAKALNPNRNLLAHNPLMLEFYENCDGDFEAIEAVISMKKPDKRMSFDEVKKISGQANQLVVEMYDVVALVKKELSPRPSSDVPLAPSAG